MTENLIFFPPLFTPLCFESVALTPVGCLTLPFPHPVLLVDKLTYTVEGERDGDKETLRRKHPYFLGDEFTWKAAPFPPGQFLGVSCLGEKLGFLLWL